MFLGGLGRIDYMHDDRSLGMLFTWFGALPVHLTSTSRTRDSACARAHGHAVKRVLVPPCAAGADAVFEKHSDSMLKPSSGVMTEVALIDLSEHAKSGPAAYKRTVARRMKRQREAVIDIVFEGFGWVSITPIEIFGLPSYTRAVRSASVRVLAGPGVTVHSRQPLMPHMLVGSTKDKWVDD